MRGFYYIYGTISGVAVFRGAVLTQWARRKMHKPVQHNGRATDKAVTAILVNWFPPLSNYDFTFASKCTFYNKMFCQNSINAMNV